MTVVTQRRSMFDALIGEPLELALSQPHQFAISAFSVALVASEASMLVGAPFNWLMAIGAEWAYLRGLSSAEVAPSVWSKRLIGSAVALLILYGTLFGLRRFGVLPADESYYAHVRVETTAGIIGALVLTLIHILSIGAVTFCSAMIHRDVTNAVRVSRESAAKLVADRELRNQQNEDARNRARQEAEDALLIEMRRKDAELRLMEETERKKMQLATERARLRAANRSAQPRTQPEIIYNGVSYPSVQAAADAHGITRQAMSKRLKKEA